MTGKLRALLVEDEPADAFLLQELVEGCKTVPVELLHVGSLAEAFELLRRTAVDVLLLDLSLPDGYGTDTVARAIAEAPGLAIVVLTGHDDEETAVRAMQEGAQDYLVKGKVDSSLLGRALRYALERKRAEAQARQAVREQVARVTAEAAERRSRLMAEASRVLASSLEYEKTLPEVGQLTLPLLADRCLLDLTLEGGQVRRWVVTEAGWKVLEGPPCKAVAPVLAGGEVRLIPDVPEAVRAELGQPELRSLLSVPIRARGETLGAVTFLRMGTGRRYREEDICFAEELAGRVVLAVDNARLYQQAQLALRKKDELVRELERSNVELEQFAYVASHDLQEPLRMVASYTQLLARRYQGKLGPDADDFIRFAVEGVTRMKRLIGDLLEYSRVGARGRSLAPVSSQSVMDRVLRNLEVTMKSAAAEVSADGLPRVLGDEVQLEQLLQNLVSNAIKFRGEAPPRVQVSAEHKGDHCLFRVSDNGIGIDPQFFGRLFVIFQRLHDREEYPGTGIGLATCKKIVERHGGRIWLESAPGQGTTFLFTLPAAQG
jgi:signal transduction histidine kinase/DNA-binding NarL/FixJ family response regulator